MSKKGYETMLAHLQPINAALIQAVDLQSAIIIWKDNLTLRVESDEIKQDTATSYLRGVAKFLNWLGDKKPSADVIRAWKAELLRNKVKPASINVWLAGLRSFFGWLAEREEIPFDPTQTIKGAKRRGVNKSHVRELLTDREVVRLLAQPKRDSPEGARDYAILCVMLYTAARGIELHRADVEDLKTMDGALVLQVQGKGHDEKDATLILSEEAESAVRDWLVFRGRKAGALFVSISNRSRGGRLSRRAIREIVKKYMGTAGIYGNKTTHSLRHTAITNAIRHGVPIHKVKGMTRHASLDTLMIYYHEVDRLTNPAERHISYASG